jgi:hypothetical protein
LGHFFTNSSDHPVEAAAVISAAIAVTFAAAAAVAEWQKAEMKHFRSR